MMLLIFNDIPLLKLAGGTLTLCWAACWLNCISGQRGTTELTTRATQGLNRFMAEYVSTVEGQRTLKWPCLLLIGHLNRFVNLHL